jgi:hypothetical protein
MASLSDRVYSMLLYLYPSDFREEYGTDMIQIFRDLHRDSKSQGVISQIHLWRRTLLDIAISVVKEYSDTLGDEMMTTIKIDQYEVVKHIETGC